MRELSLEEFIPNATDEIQLRKELKILIGRVLCKYCPELKWMETLTPKYINHEYDDVVTQKS